MGVVDFYCHKADLVIELDGSVHEGDEQKEVDAERDLILSKMGRQKPSGWARAHAEWNNIFGL